MRDYQQEYSRNIKEINWLLWPLNQEILKSQTPSSVLGWFLHLWALWYTLAWILFFTYLVFVESAGLQIMAQQLWCLSALIQVLVKYVNKVVQAKKVNQLIGWCAGVYDGPKQKANYAQVINDVFDKTNFYISFCIR